MRSPSTRDPCAAAAARLKVDLRLMDSSTQTLEQMAENSRVQKPVRPAYFVSA
jgi:hypothetical protein